MAKKKNQVYSESFGDFSTGESFADLLKEQSGAKLEGYVTKGTITDMKHGFAVVNVGLKSEAFVDLAEFAGEEPKVGDIVDVYVEHYENADGSLVASREKAKKEELWKSIESQIQGGKTIEGEITDRVRGGYSVTLLGGVAAFMPSSQLDVGPVKDIGAIMHKPMEFKIIKIDRIRSNLIVSHRAVLEGDRASRRSEILAALKVGDVMEGIIKNITDYGMFIDLGGIDGLLHITDISWKRVSNPAEMFGVGEKVKVKIINFDSETGRVSLGMKQLEGDPWSNLDKFRVGEAVMGRVTNLTDYGAFIDLGDGLEGLAHVSELSWTKKNLAPSRILSAGQEIKVQILDIDREKRRISLGVKQCQENPWTAYAGTHKVGDIIEGEVRNITEFGMFVSLTPEMDGMVHLSDLDWAKSGEEAVKAYAKGQTIKAKILEIDVEKERIGLGIKQLSRDSVADSLENLKKGEIATATITEILSDGINVEVGSVKGFIKSSELSRNRSEQRPDRFATGEKIDAKIIGIDAEKRLLTLSIKAHDIDEEKKIVKEYGSADTGAVLGDILGAVMDNKKGKK